MPEKKVKAPSRDRDLGVVKSKEASGFYLTSKNEKVPALHGLKIGDKVKLANGQYEVNGGKGDEPETTKVTDLAGVNEKFKIIEAELKALNREIKAFKSDRAEAKEAKETVKDVREEA